MQVYFINILNLVNILETNDYDNNVCNLCAKNKKYIELYILKKDELVALVRSTNSVVENSSQTPIKYGEKRVFLFSKK